MRPSKEAPPLGRATHMEAALKKPTMAAVMGHFSTITRANNWRNVEEVFNPSGAFEAVHVVALGDDFDYEEHQFGTVRVHPIRSVVKVRGGKHLNNLLVMMAGALRLRRIVETHRVDLIAHIDSTPLKYGLPAVAVAQRSGLPSVITLYSDYRISKDISNSPLLSWLSRRLWSYLFRRATRVRSVSSHIAEFAYSHGVPRERVAVIPVKTVLDTFESRPSPEALAREAEALGIGELIRDSTVFLTVGRLMAAKNVDTMLRAFAKALRQHPSMVYLIVGDGPLRLQMEAEARKLGIEEKVRFLGHFPSHDSVRNIYHLSDVFLFATLYEGQPRVVIEALLSKLPIICANYGQVCEVVEDGRDGLWVDPLDDDAVASAMVRLAADHDLRRRMSRHGGFDPGRFSLERVSADEADLYLSAISEYASSRDVSKVTA